VISLLTIPLVLAAGITRWIPILAFWLVGFVISGTGYEFWQGTANRLKRFDENIFSALWKLITRYRRRYGGYIIHIGVILMALGVIGIEMFQTETQGTIAQGEQLELGAYTMTFQNLDNFDTQDGRNVARAVVSISKNGKDLGQLYPRRDFYYDAQQPMTIPGVRSTLADDFYVILIDWKPISQAGATFKMYHNPLVKWLWVGSWVFILGIFVAAWPEKEKRTVTVSHPVRSRG
jgi:cytochrome c-type biogenesis protein CcmF